MKRAAAHEPSLDGISIRLLLHEAHCRMEDEQAWIGEVSGCHISFFEPVPGSQERLACLGGSLSAVSLATQMMLDADEPQESPTTLKLVLPNESVGGIIGKGGAAIAKLREDSCAAIKVSTTAAVSEETALTAGADQRVVTISGTMGAVLMAQLHMLATLATAGRGASSASEAGAPLNKLQKTVEPALRPVSISQIIPQAQVGGLVGKGGAVISEVRQLSQSQIKINDACEPGTSVRKVVLSGTATQVQYALNMIHARLAVPVVPMPAEADAIGAPRELEELVPAAVAGQLIGKGGVVINELRRMSGATIRIGDECEPGTEMRKLTISAPLATQAQYALGLVHLRLATLESATPPAPSGELAQLSCSSLSRELLVSDEHAGRLIGKGGAVIRALRELTGARIQIGRELEADTHQRRVTVSGTHAEVEYGFRLLQLEVTYGAAADAASAMASGLRPPRQ